MSPLPTFKKGDEVVLRKDRRTNNEGVDRLGRIVGYYFIVKDVAPDPPSVKLDLRAAADEWFDARVFEHHNVAKRFKMGDLVIGDPECQPKEAAAMADWCNEVHAVSRVHPDEPWIELYGREGYWYFAAQWKLYGPTEVAGDGERPSGSPPSSRSISTKNVVHNTLSANEVMSSDVWGGGVPGKFTLIGQPQRPEQPLDEEECKASGGHCFNPDAIVYANGDQPETCKHCGKRRIGTPQPLMRYRDA